MEVLVGSATGTSDGSLSLFTIIIHLVIPFLKQLGYFIKGGNLFFSISLQEKTLSPSLPPHSPLPDSTAAPSLAPSAAQPHLHNAYNRQE